MFGWRSASSRGIEMCIICTALVACDDDPKPAPTPAPSSHATDRGGMDGVELKLNDQPIRVDGALAYSEGGSTMEVAFVEGDVSCAALEGDGVRAHLTIASLLRPNGARQYAVTKARAGGAKAHVAHDVVMKQGDVASDVAFSADAAMDLGGSTLLLKGEVAALGCGERPPAGKPPPEARPQPTLNLSIAGHRIALAGLLARKTHERTTVELSSSPIDCAADAAVGDVELRIVSDQANGKKHAYLFGQLIPEPVELQAELDALELELGDLDEGAVEVDVSVKLAYDHHGYPVRLVGSGRAVACDGERPIPSL